MTAAGRAAAMGAAAFVAAPFLPGMAEAAAAVAGAAGLWWPIAKAGLP